MMQVLTDVLGGMVAAIQEHAADALATLKLSVAGCACSTSRRSILPTLRS